MTGSNNTDHNNNEFDIGVVPFTPEFSPCFIGHIHPPQTSLSSQCAKTPGTHAEIILYILQYFNATAKAKYHLYDGNGVITSDGNATGLLGGFQRNESDWIAPLWTLAEDRSKFVTFNSAAGDVYRACFLINPAVNINIINPVATLPGAFWPLIFTLQFSMALLLWYKGPTTKGIFQSMFTLSFESKNKSKFPTFRSRLIITIWCPSAWILSIWFKSEYVAQFSRLPMLPRDFSELSKFIGNYQLQLFEHVWISDTVLTSTSHQMRAIQSKLRSTPPVKFTNLPAYMDYLLGHRGVVALAYDGFATQQALKHPQLKLTCNDDFNGFGYVAMRRGLSRRVRRNLNTVLIRSSQFGIVQFIKRKYTRPVAKQHESPNPLTLKSAYSGLSLLGVGLLVASAAVAVEIWTYQRHNMRH